MRGFWSYCLGGGSVLEAEKVGGGDDWKGEVRRGGGGGFDEGRGYSTRCETH
jgi:hypothetical protein